MLLAMKPGASATSVVLALGLLSLSCSDAVVQALGSDISNANDRLTLKGNVCTPPADASGFPVKVVFIIDQSGSMCVSDPPGSQNGQGFCELALIKSLGAGITQPGRVRALLSLMNQFSSQPNVSVSLLPFETNLQGTYPPVGAGNRFVRATDPGIAPFINNLQGKLGKGTDYQGAWAAAEALIASDISTVQRQNPALVPRTRYVVVFLTDGTPFPRCSANTNLPVYADPDHPWLIWPDDVGAGDFCKTLQTQDQILGFIPGTDRNQNYQIFDWVDKLVALKQQYNVGDIRVHTVLLLNLAAVAACGQLCQDIYGAFPNVPPSEYAEATHKIASWLLRQIAQRGNGVFQEFLDGDIRNLGLGALDYSSMKSPFVLKSLIARHMRAVPGTNDRGQNLFVVDSDGDGLSDSDELAIRTNRFLTDSDLDCFDDLYEHRHRDQGFDPLVKDPRGCDPASPSTLGCACRDTDGDGLSQFAEAYFGTNPGLMDSDGDGIPDGLEIRFGMDPLNPNDANLDPDGDGIPNLKEIMANTNPNKKDRDLFDRDGFQYQWTVQSQADGSNCYDFSISNIKMLTPPAQAGIREGFNLFKVYFAASPQSGVATDYGVWRVGCAWAQYDPPSIREPAGPELVFRDQDFHDPPALILDSDYLGGNCVGKSP